MFSAPKTTLYFARIGLLLNSKAAASKLIKVIFTSDKTRRNILVNFEHKVSLFRLLMFVDVLVSGPQSLKMTWPVVCTSGHISRNKSSNTNFFKI